MCNDYHVPDDYDAVNELMDFAYAGPDNPDQEEANFYFALHEFKSIVERFGVDRVIKELDQDTEDELYWYYWKTFTDEDDTDMQDTSQKFIPPMDDDEVPF